LTVKNIGLYENQIGASHLVARGDVHHLHNLTDFEGKYFSLVGGMEETGRSKIHSDKNITISLTGWSKSPVVIQQGGSTIEVTKK